MKFDKTIYAQQFEECIKDHTIKQSKEFFKIKLFLQKAENSLQIAVGYLLVPDQIEKEDLEILNQSWKIFEDEYVQYFEDAKTESHIARYTAIQSYTTRRVEEIVENARKFVAKITLILGNS